jgi:hypothetical protein
MLVGFQEGARWVDVLQGQGARNRCAVEGSNDRSREFIAFKATIHCSF